MSNILIIKHGSLGDIVQISGVLRDIRETHNDKKIFILTTLPYVNLLSSCPYVDGVLMDRRLPRWNLYYLYKLKRMINDFKFSDVYDLQNSSRTSFYRKFLIRNSNWNSTETLLKKLNQKKEDFDNDSVLVRFKTQLEKSNIKVNFTLKPDFSWSVVNVDSIINKYFNKKFVLVFPFCSPDLPHKKWPHYNKIINIIRKNHKDLEIVIAPGPNEIEESKNFDATIITKNNNALSIPELSGLIKKSSFIIANDTGPAHMAAHLKKNGVVLFGYHTSAKKVSIETDNFKAISNNDLEKLTAEEVYFKIKEKLNLIN